MKPWRPRRFRRDEELWPRPGTFWYGLVTTFFAAVRAAIRTVWLCFFGSLIFAIEHAADRDPWQWQAGFISALILFTAFGIHGIDSFLQIYLTLARPDLRLPLFPRRRAEWRLTFSMGSMFGVIAGAALVFAVASPLVREGIANSEKWDFRKRLRASSPAELREILKQAAPERASDVLDEIGKRRPGPEDVALCLEIFRDRRQPSKVRFHSGLALPRGNSGVDEAVQTAFAEAMDEPDPEFQLDAAYLLSVSCPGAPELDSYWLGDRRLFEKRYRQCVPRMKQFWAERLKGRP